MLSFDFKKSSRKCFESGREFAPGESFVSALVEVGVDTQRRDFSEELWKGPDESVIGWWKSRVPERKQGRVYWAPRDVMLAYFKHVLEQPTMLDVAYVVGLLLVQKKILTLFDDGSDENNLHLHSKFEKEQYTVPVVELDPVRLQQIQEELSERLFTDEPIESEATPDD
ncbi:MAG: hypothetical protein AAF939_02930 [Planctomycetota bacterium]